jgi:glycosyltransferase involved in cell wall biosynthesis
MTRVCILTSAHPAFDTRIFRREARALADAGYDVTLITQEGRSQTVDGISLIALPEPKNRLKRMLGTWRIVQTARQQRARVYHFHDPELVPAGVLLKLWTGKAVVYDVHEDYPTFIAIKHWIPRHLRKATAKAFGIFEQVCCRFFDMVVAATDDIASNFRSHPGLVTIKNYPFLNAEGMPARTAMTEAPGDLIYIGMLALATGIPQIIEALSYIDDRTNVQLKLAGRFADDGCQELVASARQAGRVEYLGFLDRETLMEELGKADIGLACLQPILPYVTSEPNKLFEYMRSGLPIIASDFDLWREIIEGAQCGIVVDPEDPRAIGQAISQLLADPALMQAMGINGQQAVRHTYNWESQKAKLLEAYADIAG